ncbi:MAG: hypothetical protein IT223_04475 [Crocinitomicaceae bacterium]|nr:hypothetical protein [Crocinitomicaceae bacterium]
MKTIIRVVIIMILLNFFSVSGIAQYEVVTTTGGVEFSVRWASEKWYKPKGPMVLLVKVANTNDYPVTYTIGIDISRNGKMLESSAITEHSLRAHGVVRGRLNGIVYPMASLTQEDIVAKNFDLDLSGLEIEKKQEEIK